MHDDFIITDCAIVKGYAIIIAQYLRGDFNEIPDNPDKPSLEDLKGYAEEMSELATKINQHIRDLKNAI